MEPSAPAAGTSNSSNELTKLAELEQEVAEAEQRVISGKVNTFVHPPERHISVDPHELKMAIKNRLEDRRSFDELTKLMEGVANFDFFDLKQRMRNNFLPFSSGANNTIYLQRSSKALPTSDVLDEKEDDFIADVYEVLRASHYTLLTKEEWDLATSENFNLNLPMTVNWDYMDKELLEKFWQSSDLRQEIRKNLPDCMADRILVFHRGLGTARTTGLLIDQKLDLLMDYTVFHILDMITKPFRKPTPEEKLEKKVRALQAQQAQQAAVSGRASASGLNLHIVDSLPDKFLKAMEVVMGSMGSRTSSPEPVASPAGRVSCRASLSGTSFTNPVSKESDNLAASALSSYEYEDGAMIASRHRFAKRIERLTLARQCPTLLTLLKAFPKSMSLQEPTFKDLVVVYRRALPPRKPPTASANAPNKNKEERLQGILQYRNINIKVFGETPMADVEMIFPDKVVGIKPFQLVNLMVTVVTALMAGALVLWKATNINMNILWTAASLVLTRCFAVYTQAQTQRTMMQQEMTSSLYDKMQDSQEGVISVITEELSDQQLKQMLLAYMVLIMKGRPMLEQDLDDACEDFLLKEFEHPIDYDLDAALPRLQTWGLIKKNHQGKLEALPMPEAIELLQGAWSTAYKEVGKQGEEKVPTIDMVTGTWSVFGEGIKNNRQQQQHKAEQAAAEANKKSGFVGKTMGMGKNLLFTTNSTKANGTADPDYPAAAYSGGGAPPGPPSDMAVAADGSERGSAGGSGGGAVERKKSGSFRGMLKKLKT